MTVISAWWRLNIRFKTPVGDRVGVELLFNSVEFGSQSSCQQTSRELETRCGREGHTRPRGPSEAPMEWTPTSGEQERHNVSVITVGSKYEVYVRSLAPSHMLTLEQPFRTLQIKWEVNIFLKKSSCVVYYCVCYHCVDMYPVYIYVCNIY